MEKSIDRILMRHNKTTDSVEVMYQIYLVRTDDASSALVAFDAKSFKYICNFEGHDLADRKRYALYKPEYSNHQGLYSFDITPYVEELNQLKIILTDKLVMQIKHIMPSRWYIDYSEQNDLLPLEELKAMQEGGYEENP